MQSIFDIEMLLVINKSKYFATNSGFLINIINRIKSGTPDINIY